MNEKIGKIKLELLKEEFIKQIKDSYTLNLSMVLLEEFENLQQENQQLKERIDKAIEYIEKDYSFTKRHDIPLLTKDEQLAGKLLDILARKNSAITHLYDEVEIIGEGKKIDNLMPKHLSNEFIQQIDKCITHQDIKCIAHKVNEVINYLQHINKEEK